jgi:D-inositol-3-phosphate glycosyltransferase
VTGVLVPPRDPAATAAAVGRLMADPAALARLGASAADAVAARYSWAAVAEATEHVYREAGAAVPPSEPLVPARTGRKDR